MFMIQHNTTGDYVSFDQLGNPAGLDAWEGTRFVSKEAAQHVWRFACLTHTCSVIEVLEEVTAVIDLRRGRVIERR